MTQKKYFEEMMAEHFQRLGLLWVHCWLLPLLIMGRVWLCVSHHLVKYVGLFCIKRVEVEVIQLAPEKDAPFFSQVLHVRCWVRLICVLSGCVCSVAALVAFGSSLASLSFRIGSGLSLPAEFGVCALVRFLSE